MIAKQPDHNLRQGLTAVTFPDFSLVSEKPGVPLK